MFSLDTRQFWGSYRKSVFKYVRDLRVEERPAWTHGAQGRAAQPDNTSVSSGPCPHSATPATSRCQVPAHPCPSTPLSSPCFQYWLSDGRARMWVWLQEAPNPRPVLAPVSLSPCVALRQITTSPSLRFPC